MKELSGVVEGASIADGHRVEPGGQAETAHVGREPGRGCHPMPPPTLEPVPFRPRPDAAPGSSPPLLNPLHMTETGAAAAPNRKPCPAGDDLGDASLCKSASLRRSSALPVEVGAGLMAQRWDQAVATEKAQRPHLGDVGDDARGVGLTDEAHEQSSQAGVPCIRHSSQLMERWVMPASNQDPVTYR